MGLQRNIGNGMNAQFRTTQPQGNAYGFNGQRPPQAPQVEDPTLPPYQVGDRGSEGAGAGVTPVGNGQSSLGRGDFNNGRMIDSGFSGGIDQSALNNMQIHPGVSGVPSFGNNVPQLLGTGWNPGSGGGRGGMTMAPSWLRNGKNIRGM